MRGKPRIYGRPSVPTQVPSLPGTGLSQQGFDAVPNTGCKHKSRVYGLPLANVGGLRARVSCS